MNNTMYQLDQVTKSYQVDGNEHVVLEKVSLTISSEDITVILGASGCGKTTLLRIIAKLETYDQGEIVFTKNKKTENPKVGLVFQESRLMPWLTVFENIGFHQNATKEEIERYLKMMKLEKFSKCYPNELSGGMAQRVSIARALSFEPDFLLMDEPFSALDYFTRMEMQNEVAWLHEKTNKGVIFVTHDIDEALRIGTQIIVFTKDRQLKRFDLTKGEISNEALKEIILETLR
ncbi:alkanesulfonates ABC transporter ATP-binding protein / Sulfonate ABC transporter, ATP-binding subunit SsuB [Lachnospiraceae bacterium KM106-2]|nr:alkanesulfonates ABC transporter ATP-binding protein / Sulfonate ABC transporter, ATP-binding subunit SsuB [Lachnospiraceae bacterium KM106-2]